MIHPYKASLQLFLIGRMRCPLLTRMWVIEVPTLSYLVCGLPWVLLQPLSLGGIFSFKELNKVTFTEFKQALQYLQNLLLIVPLQEFFIPMKRLCLSVKTFDPISFRSNLFF